MTSLKLSSQCKTGESDVFSKFVAFNIAVPDSDNVFLFNTQPGNLIRDV